MAVNLSHSDCITILRNPSTQNILEKLGYEYSARGHAEYRRSRPNIVPALVQAIVIELERHAVFPSEYEDHLPEIGVYILKQGNGFSLIDIDKPSARQEHVFALVDGAARGYVRKVLEPYWIQPDADSGISIRRRLPQSKPDHGS